MKRDRFIATIFGKQGSGKTTFLKQKIVPDLPKPIFILDTMDEYFDGLIFYDMFNLKGHLINNNMNASGVHILKSDNDPDTFSFFELFTRVKEPATIIIEEADKFMSSHKINEDIENIINYGRHWEQNLIFLARRPAKVHKDVTSQSNFIVSFRQTESNDIKALKSSYDKADELPELEKWRFGSPFINGKHYLILDSENVPAYLDI